MKTLAKLATLSFAVLFLSPSGCANESGANDEAPKGKAPVADPAPADTAVKGRHGAAEHAAHADQDSGKQPTLKQLMTQLGVDMGGIATGLWREDFAVIAKHAKAIADHPHASTEEKKRVIKTLGSDFGSFVKGDRAVHDTAMRLYAAANKANMAGTLKELAALQQGCVSCHALFRKRLLTPKKP